MIQSASLVSRVSSLIVAAFVISALNGCVVSANFFPEYDTLHEVRVKKADSIFTTNKILMLDCGGIVSSDDVHGLGGRPSMLSYVKNSLEKAKDDPSIKAVLLRIDSPGGGVTASDLIYRELQEFRKERKEDGKPVVITASMMDMAASGGYYIAMAADKVYAHPTTITGSIGVLAIFPNAKGFGDKIGLHMNVIKSGENKDIGSMFRLMTDDEREILQAMIDEMYDRFVKIVADNRSMLTEEQIRELADGRIYTSQEAREHQLIDDVNYLDDAIDATKELAQISDAKVVLYSYEYLPSANIYTQARFNASTNNAPNPSGAASLIHIDADSLLQREWPRFEYRYYPNL